MTDHRITLDTWRSKSPAALAALLFQPNGPVARHVANYAYNSAQARYAESVIATMRRGETPPATVTFAEASTGVGKTLGYLVPALIEAMLTRQRVLVSTYTLELQRQIFRDDGPIAIKIVADVTGREPVIAPRRARSNFASPSSCRRFAKVDDNPARATALANLADFAERALALSAPASDPWRQIEAGLIDVWRDANDELAAELIDLDHSTFAVDAASPREEQALWALAASLAADADCLIATHASTLIDMKQWGKLHGAKYSPFAIAILDEADQIESAAHSALGVERSIPRLIDRLRALQTALADARLPRDQAIEIANVILKAMSVIEPVVAATRELAPTPGMTTLAVFNNAAWLDGLREASQAIEAVETVGKSVKDHGFADELHALSRAGADILTFLDCLAENKGNTGNRFGRASLAFSPKSQAPSLVVRALGGGRIMSRLWNEKAELSRSILVTSATLAYPTKNASIAFEFMAKALGVRDPARINHDLNVTLEPTEFGHPTFVLAHPTSPSPNREGDEREIRAESWLLYSAEAIVAAAGRAKGRTLVLCTSHTDAMHIADRINDRLGERLFVRGPRDSLAKTLAAAEARADAVVIAAGAWQGLNRPGFFTTGVIVRLPFTPKPSFPTEGHADSKPTFSMWDVIRLLRQGIGRFIRRKDDAPEIWIVDPRIGLPPAQRDKLIDGQLLTAHPQSQTAYLKAAIPTRFLKALNAAELFKGTAKKSTSRKAAAPRAKGKRGSAQPSA